jgi:hypothetical protein
VLALKQILTTLFLPCGRECFKNGMLSNEQTLIAILYGKEIVEKMHNKQAKQ